MKHTIRRKLLSALLVACMAMTLTPAAFATEGESTEPEIADEVQSSEVEAMIGADGFSTLKDAVEKATDGQTITLNKEVNLTENLVIGAESTAKNIILDLNGQTLNAGSYTISVNHDSALTIQDSSTTAVGNITAENQMEVTAATLILNSGKINITGNSYGVYVSDGGTVIVNGGTIESNYAPLAGNNTTGDMNFEIHAGTLTAKNGPAIYMPGQMNLTITGGTLNGGISLRMGQVNISGGTINATTGSVDAVKDYYDYSGNAWLPDALYVFNGTYTSENEQYGNSLNLNITGGTFNCTNGQGSAVVIYDLGKVEQSSSVSISGTAALSTTTDNRDAYKVFSLSDIGVDSPKEGYGNKEYTEKVKTTISGGTFSTVVDDDYLATGYECSGSGTSWTVSESKDGAMTVTPDTDETGGISATLDGIYQGDSTEIESPTGDDQPSGNAESGSIAIDLTTTNDSDATKATLNVTAGAAQSLGRANSLTVQTDVGDVHLNDAALDKVAGTTGDVTITITKNDNSNVKASYTVEVKSGDVNLLPEGENNGTVTITVDKPEATNLQAWYVVDGADKSLIYVEKLNTQDAGTGKVAIDINHLSTIVLIDGDPENTVAATITNSTGTHYYATLNEAINNVSDGETINIERDIPDATGISVPSNKDFTIDFGGHTYTLTGPGAGSTNTETNGFQLLRDSTIVFKNGTIRIAENANNIKRIIQNYADLTLEDMNFYAQNQIGGEDLVLSFNQGNIIFKGNTNIYVSDPENTIAFDVYYWENAYEEGSHITFDETFTGTIEGYIVYDSSDSDKGELTINGSGTFTGISLGTTVGSTNSDADGIIVNSGRYANQLDSEWLADGLNTELHSQRDGMYTYYASIDAALAAAQPGDVVSVVNSPESVESYTVTLDYANGSDKMTLSLTDGATFTLPSLTRSEYELVGWGCGRDFYEAGEMVTVRGDMAFTAIWRETNPPYTGEYNYPVTVKDSEHGTVTIAKEDQWANDGEKITVTVTPDDACMLDKLVITDKNGKELEYVDNGDGTYTFTMPEGAVTITATFVEDPNWEEPTEPEEPNEPALPFSDVNEGDWFYDVVEYVYNEGLITGTSATTFEPNTTTTRGMIVSILHRLEGSPVVTGSDFTDVNDSDWYGQAVAWAAREGIVAGFENGTFQPNAAVTREQMAAILYNYAEYKGIDTSARADLSAYSDQPSAWAQDVMEWANAEGLITGTTATTLDPQGTATRAQVAAMLQRFIENVL